MKPKFFILAGPNGAGKSSYGRLRVPLSIPIFDGDLVFAELQQQYPHIEAERLSGGVAVALEKARDTALSEKAGFAFETNFSNDMAIDITRMFKEAGFETILLYFGLDDLETSASRVDTRVQLGGHEVPLDTIRFNMEEGIIRVTNNLADFDSVYFLDTGSGQSNYIAFCTKEGANYALLDNNIKWFNKNFKEPLQNLHKANLQSLASGQDENINPGPGRS